LKSRKLCELLSLRELFKELTFGTLVERVNRFSAVVKTDSGVKKAHISDTGRLKELLTFGAPLLLAENPRGKLDYKLVAVKSDKDWVFLYTPAHLLIAEKLLRKGFLGFYPKEIRKEVKHGKSRIDLLIDGNFYLEVKGCNLVKGCTCLFPDAPTERGRKHLKELISLRQKGFRTGVLFLAFRPCSCFSPNAETDPLFAESFKRALSSGVEFFGVKLKFLPETGGIYVDGKLPLC
jgi:sugar fermentation stimulation protein A